MKYKDYLLREIRLASGASVGNGCVPDRFRSTELERCERELELVYSDTVKHRPDFISWSKMPKPTM